LFVGSSAGRSSSIAELGICETYSRLLQLLDRRSVVDGMTYLHRLNHNDPTAGVTTALARQVRDRAALSVKPAARLTERVSSADPDIRSYGH